MILDLFLYFAKFPLLDGVKRIATKGASNMPEYAELLQQLERQEEHSLIPGIGNYIYGQSFEDLKGRLDRITGSFLFVDYGEMRTSADRIQSLQVSERLAITVAFKLAQTDALEQAIASERTLQMLATLYSFLLADIETGAFRYADRPAIDNTEIVPFVSSELSAYGWTLMLSVSSPDALGIHEQFKSFMRHT